MYLLFQSICVCADENIISISEVVQVIEVVQLLVEYNLHNYMTRYNEWLFSREVFYVNIPDIQTSNPEQ